MAPSALVRSASFHNVGDDGGGGGASTSASANAEDTGVTIMTLTMDRFESFAKCHNDSFGTKVSCLCVPVASGPDRFRSFYTKNPDRLALCGVALRASGEVVGYVQYAPFPYSDKDGLHETKEGECYVEQLSVSAGARGLGLGTRLLEWCEARARDAGCNHMTLAVINGNRARALYERLGYVAVEQDCVDECCGCLFVFLLVGRPYGLCAPWGAVDMRKELN